MLLRGMNGLSAEQSALSISVPPHDRGREPNQPSKGVVVSNRFDCISKVVDDFFILCHVCDLVWLSSRDLLLPWFVMSLDRSYVAPEFELQFLFRIRIRLRSNMH